mgnify:CR=1 FL=1
MLKLYYCPKCKRILDRGKVFHEMYEEGYRCKWCGGGVSNAYKLMAGMLGDFVEYLESHGKDMDDYE